MNNEKSKRTKLDFSYIFLQFKKQECFASYIIIELKHHMTKLATTLIVCSLVVFTTLSQSSKANEKAFQATQKAKLFKEWKDKYGVNYPPEEDNYRALVFGNNVDAINQHNSKPDKTYTQGINQFSATPLAEFIETYLKSTPDMFSTLSADIDWASDDVTPRNLQIVSLDYKNWTEEGKVTAVKNQGACGSCWAFCSTAALESTYLIDRAITLSLSEQELVDCSSTYGNSGCNGGWPTNAYRYIIAKQILSTSSYPYVAKKQRCKRTKTAKPTYPMKSYGYITGGNCDTVKTQVALRPGAVAVDATYWGRYVNGTFTCNSTAINHGVLLVGYKSDGSWIIKNSWGTGWGQSGYITLASGNSCAVCNYFMPTYL